MPQDIMLPDGGLVSGGWEVQLWKSSTPESKLMMFHIIRLFGDRPIVDPNQEPILSAAGSYTVQTF